MAPSSSRKGQVSTVDFIIGITVMIMAIVMVSSLVISSQKPSEYALVQKAAFAASDQLMTQGIPITWSATNVTALGVLSGSVLDADKWVAAQGISSQRLNQMLSPQMHVYAYLENASSVVRIGSCGLGVATVDALCKPSFAAKGDMVSVTRYVAFNSTIMRLVVVVWK
jgi:hypothetical protein